MTHAPRELRPSDVLFVPHPRRLSREDGVGPDGARTLTIHYGDKEVALESAALTAFGERLIAEPRFVAGDARAWSRDGYDWTTLSALLEALLDAGILQRDGEPAPPPAPPALTTAAELASWGRADRVPPVGGVARAWTPEDCAALSTAVFGVAVEPGNLESLLRGIRIAHPTIDAGGRQIGEANVFPAPLRLDLPTKRRACPYHGSRFHHDLPMNATGFEPVQRHWRDVLHDLRAIKRAFFRRRPPGSGGLTVVDLHVLGSVILSIPAFMMHRAIAPVRNGELPTEASALFRVVDGVRMITREILLTGAMGPDAVPTAEELHRFADRRLLLISDVGVCAGPPAMIDTLLRAVTSLDAGEDATVSPGSLIGDVEAATRYGIAACAIEATLDQFWLRQGAIVERLRAALDPPSDDAREAALRARLDVALADSPRAYAQPTPAAQREGFDASLARIVERCDELRGATRAAATPSPDDDAAEPRDVSGTPRAIAIAIAELRALERAIFPRVAERQAECNAVLGRAPPSRPFDEVDTAAAWPVASLRAALSETLGIAVDARGERRG